MVIILKLDIKAADTPIPINALETKNPKKESDKEKKNAPNEEINKKYKFVFFGPISSNNFPSGICIKANAKKYIEVIKPIWELVKKNSSLSGITIMALTDLKQ